MSGRDLVATVQNFEWVRGVEDLFLIVDYADAGETDEHDAAMARMIVLKIRTVRGLYEDWRDENDGLKGAPPCRGDLNARLDALAADRRELALTAMLGVLEIAEKASERAS